MESRGRAGSEMLGKSGSEFLAADDTRHSVSSMVLIEFQAGVFAGCECPSVL